MPKATLAQITDCGFNAAQFGTPADWATATTGYVARLLAAAQDWVEAKYGEAAYAAASGSTDYALQQAELCWAKAELWRRRAAFIDANAFTGLGVSAARERESYLAHAQSAMECAEDWLATATQGSSTPAGTGVSLKHYESGPYPESAT